MQRSNSKIRSSSKSPETIRVQNQTNEEWLQEYSGIDGHAVKASVDGSTAPPRTPSQAPPAANEWSILKYIDFRTAHHPETNNDRLIMEFECQATGRTAVAFFNVSIRYQRGPKKGKPKKHGTRGEFYPPNRRKGKFKDFWIQATEQSPKRWSTVYKQMHKLQHLNYTGRLIKQSDRSGKAFYQIEDLMCCLGKTSMEQPWNNFGTSLEQGSGTSISV